MTSNASPHPALRPGFLALHGNRLETLAEVTLDWLARHPLGTLEEEVFLVQSNGMAEWLKMHMAERTGICAATRVELPARFIWRAYRAVLGRDAVPPSSPLDRRPLVWRCMSLLPTLIGRPGFEPVARFLTAGAQPLRRLQLAERLADLFDQYQVYRSDWLTDWAAGRDQLSPRGTPVPPEQVWQPVLWRELLAGLHDDDRRSARPALHRRFLEALAAPVAGGRQPNQPGLPRRLVLFGTTHIPHQTLEALAALARHCQVLMVVPNPCQFHWSDLIEGRELLGSAPARHALRRGVSLVDKPLEALHAHGHPLLAAWGRQSRDFIRQLDGFDDTRRSREWMDLPRVDLFDDGAGENLLQRVQARIRDLEPLDERCEPPLNAEDRSISFHITHSAQREVEVLHDQLLHRLAAAGGQPPLPPLAPRDIVVMVPDIDRFAPAIRAVFGQYSRQDPRFIPWGIADQRNRGRHPVLLALEWLMGAPQSRFTVTELRELLEVPAVARRFGLDDDGIGRLFEWIEGAGIRWGLDAKQRAGLGLESCAEANTWSFGLQRMLLGYATGELDAAHAGIEPYSEVGGLEAGLAGQLAECIAAVQGWWADSRLARQPAQWGTRLRTLMQTFLLPANEADREVLAALGEGLADWLQACEAAGFDEDVDVSVVRESWLEAVDTPGIGSRFKAGGVTFCTLLPLRAIPFELVCLLGMNDGDFPRRQPRSDFDLMALPGQARPGDRSRRDDDRQLMLDALLSARRALYISWSGHSVRDNQEQQPSVLVAQLRDYLTAGWGQEAVQARTTTHPLQPFSRRYFEAGSGRLGEEAVLTYAKQWRSAHINRSSEAVPGTLTAPEGQPPPPLKLDLAALTRFLRNPVRAFFEERLQVRFDDPPSAAPDDEVFAITGLEDWRLADEVLATWTTGAEGTPADVAAVRAALARQSARGVLPLAGPGLVEQERLAARLSPMLLQWQSDLRLHAAPTDAVSIDVRTPAGDTLQDVVGQLRLSEAGHPGPDGEGPSVARITLVTGKLLRPKPGAQPKDDNGIAIPVSDTVRKVRLDKLLGPWLQWLAGAASGRPIALILIGSDARLEVRPAPIAPEHRHAAAQELEGLLQAAGEGLRGDGPVPTAILSGLAVLTGVDRLDTVYDGSERSRGEGEEPCLNRLYPDASTLQAEPDFVSASQRLYASFLDWAADFVSCQKLDGAGADGDDGAENDD